MEMVEVAKGDRGVLSWNLNKLQMMLMSKGDNMLGILILRPPKDTELNDIRVQFFQKSQYAKH